mmetsp:Transcript_63026/g.148009  ORF Transcript_63026/g.148009 Transcript_63026/m.148009 type:complete len:256 (+) Transcript_63026:31-798(+)
MVSFGCSPSLLGGSPASSPGRPRGIRRSSRGCWVLAVVAAWIGSVSLLTASAFRMLSLAMLTDSTIPEPSTGVSFPAHIHTQELMANGVRTKWGKIKVYAMGLYLEERSKLWGLSSVNVRDLAKEAPGRVTLRIVITSSFVSTRKLSEAMREALRPRLLKELPPAKADEVLADFLHALEAGPPLKRGIRLQFAFGKNTVKIRMGPTYIAHVSSKFLTNALLSVYLDGNAVEPSFRDAVFKGLATRSSKETSATFV